MIVTLTEFPAGMLDEERVRFVVKLPAKTDSGNNSKKPQSTSTINPNQLFRMRCDRFLGGPFV